MTTDCEAKIGAVIFDCICLMLGAGEARAALTGEAAEEMAEAARPVLSKMEQYIATMASKESSTTEVAGAVFGVVFYNLEWRLLRCSRWFLVRAPVCWR